MHRQLTVLHVDDDPDMLALSRAAFEQVDAVSLLTAESASEALDVVDSTSIDCLVSDSLVLPDGVPLVQAVRREDADVPILLFTAKEWVEVSDVASAAGVTEYVQKAGPSDLTTVIERIRSFVDEGGDVDEALATGATTVDDAVAEHADAASKASLGPAEEWELIGQWLGEEELGIVIVEAVEAHAGITAIDRPLFEFIDTDALEELLRPLVETQERPGIEVRFPYGEYELAVTSTGDVLARPNTDDVR